MAQNVEAKGTLVESKCTAAESKAVPTLLELVRKWHADSKLECSIEDEEELKFQLVCYLRARENDVDEALKMYAGSMRWRADNNVDHILDTPFAKMDEVTVLVPFVHHGFCKQGRPIYIERTGNQSVDLLLSRLTDAEFIDYHIRFMETMQRRAMAKSQETGRRVKSMLLILDMTGLSFDHRKLMKWLKLQAHIDSTYYAEALGKLIIINAPSVFSMVWSLAKTVVEPVTLKKFHIHGKERKEWLPTLLQYIDRDQLPIEYGGLCRCEGKGPSEATQMTTREQVARLQPCLVVQSVKPIKDRVKAEKRASPRSTSRLFSF